MILDGHEWESFFDLPVSEIALCLGGDEGRPIPRSRVP